MHPFLDRFAFIGTQILISMITPVIIHHLRADSFALPLANSSVEMVMAMNTLTCFAEFARVCRPGGVILYVDSSADWIVNLAVRLISLQMRLTLIRKERVDLGFYIVVRM